MWLPTEMPSKEFYLIVYDGRKTWMEDYLKYLGNFSFFGLGGKVFKGSTRLRKMSNGKVERKEGTYYFVRWDKDVPINHAICVGSKFGLKSDIP